MKKQTFEKLVKQYEKESGVSKENWISDLFLDFDYEAAIDAGHVFFENSTLEKKFNNLVKKYGSQKVCDAIFDYDLEEHLIQCEISENLKTANFNLSKQKAYFVDSYPDTQIRAIGVKGFDVAELIKKLK